MGEGGGDGWRRRVEEEETQLICSHSSPETFESQTSAHVFLAEHVRMFSGKISENMWHQVKILMNFEVQ